MIWFTKFHVELVLFFEFNKMLELMVEFILISLAASVSDSIRTKSERCRIGDQSHRFFVQKMIFQWKKSLKADWSMFYDKFNVLYNRENIESYVKSLYFLDEAAEGSIPYTKTEVKKRKSQYGVTMIVVESFN